MGQVLHRDATTTEAVRRAIQHSQESLRALARRHGINPKTVAKWRKRCSVSDLRTGPKHPRSTVLTVQQEAVIVAFRRHTLLPLDDCLYALQAMPLRLCPLKSSPCTTNSCSINTNSLLDPLDDDQRSLPSREPTDTGCGRAFHLAEGAREAVLAHLVSRPVRPSKCTDPRNVN